MVEEGREEAAFEHESLANHSPSAPLTSHGPDSEDLWTVPSPGVFDHIYKLMKPDKAVAGASQRVRTAGSRALFFCPVGEFGKVAPSPTPLHLYL